MQNYMFKKLLERLGLITTFKRPDFRINMKDGTGFVDAIPEPEDFVLGGSRQALKMILSEERDYTNFLPVYESQKRGFDSYSCVPYSGLNNLEIIFKKLFGFEINYSDRFSAAMTPVTPNQGTTYSKFWDSVRKYGLVLEEEYPWGGGDGFQYVQKPPQEIIDKGQIFLNQFEVQHDWIDYGGCDPEKLYKALLHGPLQASVDAGATYNGSYSKNINHSITIYKAVKGKKFGIFDHYSRETYEVPWNFYFGSAKQATLISKKKVQLVWRPFMTPHEEAAKIFAVYGMTACHIADEYSWNYGSKLGIWDKNKLANLTNTTFNNKFTIGDSISFK